MGMPRAVLVVAAEAATATATVDEGAPSRPPETTATATQTPRTNAAEDDGQDEDEGEGEDEGGSGCWRTMQRPPGYLYASAGGQTHHAPRTPPRTVFVFVSVFGPQHARARPGGG